MCAFDLAAPSFAAYLDAAKDDTALRPAGWAASSNARFIARNFLLEERLDPMRVASYAASLPANGPQNLHEWDQAHNDYLKVGVFLHPPATHDYRSVDRNDPNVCPETFRALRALVPFSGTDLDVHLLRLVQTSDIAHLSGADDNDVYSLGEKVMADPARSATERDNLSLIFENAFASPLWDHRPVFAGFYEDFQDDLRDPLDSSWADRVRDRHGLYHIGQGQPGGLPRRVFLFRYPVRDLPHHPGAADQRPLAVPVVLDHRFSEAFCPAPVALDRGRVLNLEPNASDEPVREVLHLSMPIQVEHLFRVGQVHTSVPYDLAPQRRNHLVWLQLLSGRDDYAVNTDTDLLT